MEVLHTAECESPLGTLRVVSSARGLVYLELPRASGRGFGGWAAKHAPGARVLDDRKPNRAVLTQLEEYFEGKRKKFELSLDLRATEFQRGVYEHVGAIDYGETRTYSDIARALGRPTATRAVGAANGANPIPLIVPCHRVVGSGASSRATPAGSTPRRACWRWSAARCPSARCSEETQYERFEIDGYRPSMSFGRASALLHDHRGDEEAAVEFLARRAGEGPILELAIGTGRLALPLAERGFRVDGIDIAPAMVDRLRAKPGGDAISVVIGDFADVAVSGEYALVFVAWNSFFNLLTQEDQLRCFANVVPRLAEGGRFVIEAFSPAFLYRYAGDQQVEVEDIGVDSVRLGVLRHDPSTQILENSHVELGAEGVRATPVVQRYVWPSELDLMARLAGLRLDERFASWQRDPFDARSEAHVSVYCAG